MIHDEYLQYENRMEERESKLKGNAAAAEENLNLIKSKPEKRFSSRTNSEEKSDDEMCQKMLLFD